MPLRCRDSGETSRVLPCACGAACPPALPAALSPCCQGGIQQLCTTAWLYNINCTCFQVRLSQSVSQRPATASWGCTPANVSFLPAQVRRELIKCTDARVRLVTEVITGIKVKFAFEKNVPHSIGGIGRSMSAHQLKSGNVLSAPGAALRRQPRAVTRTCCTKGALDGHFPSEVCCHTSKHCRPYSPSSGVEVLPACCSDALPEQHSRLTTVASPLRCRPVCMPLVNKTKAGSHLVAAVDWNNTEEVQLLRPAGHQALRLGGAIHQASLRAAAC